MASNSPFSSGSSVSSILKGAQSTANQIATYNDSIAAFEYENSGHSDASYAQYKKYLLGRINTLKGGDLTSQQKALTLTKTLESATHSNVSANIQRENIQIMAGGANLTDKYNLISGQFSRAVANGDYTLAQSLESQAYSVSQQIQYQQQTAANAADSLAKASEASVSKYAKASAKSEGNVGKSLEGDLQNFNYDYAHAGQKTAGKLLDKFVQSHEAQFKALGIVLQPGAKPNYFDIVDGTNRAIYKAYSLAGDAAAPYASDGGQSWYNKANGVLTGIDTIYGKMDAQQLVNAANNPNQFSYNEAPDYTGQPKGGVGGRTNPQVGYSLTPQSGVQPIVSNSPWVDIPNDMTNKINALGLNVVGSKQEGGNAYTVHTTDKSPDWLKNILPGQATTEVVNNNQTLGVPNAMQFEADATAQNATGKAVYTTTYDGQGRKAVYESSNMGDRVVYSDPGYDFNYAPNAHDVNMQPQLHKSFWSKLGGYANTGLSDLTNVFGGQASASGMTKAAEIEQQNAIWAEKQAEKNIRLSLPALPKLTLQPRAQAQTRINTVSPRPVTPYPVQAPHTVNPQGGARAVGPSGSKSTAGTGLQNTGGANIGFGTLSL